jgi:hypothetical protein
MALFLYDKTTICNTFAYPASESQVQKSMIFISEKLTKRTYRSKRIDLNYPKIYIASGRGLSDDEEEEGTTTMRKNENERYERSNKIRLFPL